MRSHIILFRVLYTWCSINLRSCGYLLAFGVVFICLLTIHLPVKASSETTAICIYTSVYYSGVAQYIVYIMGCACGQEFLLPPVCPDSLCVPSASCQLCNWMLFTGLKRLNCESDY
jgi:hypothetical protein